MKPKKRIVKKTVKKASKKSKEKMLGKVEHVFEKIGVITMTLKNPLKAGDMVHIKGHTTDFYQPVVSMQIEHVDVKKAKKGDGVGIKTEQTVRDTDAVYLADKKAAESYFKMRATNANAGIKQVYNPIPPQRSLSGPQVFRKPQMPAPPSGTGPKFMSF